MRYHFYIALLLTWWCATQSSPKTFHYNDVITSAMASQITGATIVYSTVCPGADQRNHQSSASLAIVSGIHRSPVNSPHKGPVTRKCFHLMTWWRHHADYRYDAVICKEVSTMDSPEGEISFQRLMYPILLSLLCSIISRLNARSHKVCIPLGPLYLH